ncbi:MAG: hypothetical protein RI906_43 [Pseudomonadota bacterium]
MPQLPDGGLPEQVLPCLEPHFQIHREVSGHHPIGKRLRIDAILVPRDPTDWARPDVALGVEFKRSTAAGRKDSSKVIRQCMDYTVTDWKGFGVGLPIFFCPGFDAIQAWREVRAWTPYSTVDDGFLGRTVANPPLTDQQWHRAGMGYAISGILGQHNVGELVNRDRDGWSFIKHGGGFHVQWCERRGVCEARRNQLRRIVGSG